MSGKFQKIRPSYALMATKYFSKNTFLILRRSVFTQDALFGMENRENLQRMKILEKAVGPSMLMRARDYNISLPFISTSESIQGNDDVFRVFGHNKFKIPPNVYAEFPESVMKNIQGRKGLTEISLMYDTEQWNPDRLLKAINKLGLDRVLNLDTTRLFQTYLKRRNATEEEIDRMYTAIIAKHCQAYGIEPGSKGWREYFRENQFSLQPKELELKVKDVKKADETLPSFTDIEFALFFLKTPPEEQYNMCCVLNGGHLIATQEIRHRLEVLLALLRDNKMEEYERQLQEFLEITKGDKEKPCRTDKIVECLRNLPLFATVFEQGTEYMYDNIAALAVKIDAYLLNLVKPREVLVVNLHLPFVHAGAPHFVTLFFSVNDEGAIIVRELLADSNDPLSLSAPQLDKRLKQSLLFCGTPSVDFSILANPQDMEEIIDGAMKTLWRETTGVNNPSQLFKSRLDALYTVFSDPNAKLRQLDGTPITLSGKEKTVYERLEDISTSEFITLKFELKKKPVATITIPDVAKDISNPNPKDVVVLDLNDIRNVDFHPFLSVNLDEKFERDRARNEVPKGFPWPSRYSGHLGVAAPDSPLNKHWKAMSYTGFLATIAAKEVEKIVNKEAEQPMKKLDVIDQGKEQD